MTDHTPMSDAEIAEALARCEKATEGPWVPDDEAESVCVECKRMSVTGDEPYSMAVASYVGEDDRPLIAACRTDLPRALRDLVQARERIAFLESALYDIAEVGDGYGARSKQSGTNGEGHQDCRGIADAALRIEWDDLPDSSDDADTRPLRDRHRARMEGAKP
jgi:hypothetical protein